MRDYLWKVFSRQFEYCRAMYREQGLTKTTKDAQQYILSFCNYLSRLSQIATYFEPARPCPPQVGLAGHGFVTYS